MMSTTLTPHGVPNQLNVYALDVESSVTSHGRHNRLVVFTEPNNRREIYVREDVRGLPMATREDLLRVAMHHSHRMHPAGMRLEFVSSSEVYDTRLGQSVDHYLRAV